MSDTVFLLCVVAAFAAGFVDAIAGGGGLITLPALTLAGLDPVSAVATNKLQSSFGSGSAMLTFARAGHLDLARAWRLAAPAAAGSVAGAALIAYLPTDLVAAILPFVLMAVAIYFALSPTISDVGKRARIGAVAFNLTALPLIGVYDGMFGPGAGSFYMLAFVALQGYGAVKATAHTKLVNFASNIAGLGALAVTGHVFWTLGLAMGAAQFVGARFGAHAAIRSGARLIRPLLATICLIIAARLAISRF